MSIGGLTRLANQWAVVQADAAWTELIDERIDDAPTSICSNAMDVTHESGVWVWIEIDSTLAPTLLRFQAQYSYDGGTSWADYEEGLWASLCWEDLDTADGVEKIYRLDCGGVDTIRICAIGTGTDATNYFDVVVRARGFHGPTSAGHA